MVRRSTSSDGSCSPRSRGLARVALALALGGCEAPAPSRGTDVPRVDTAPDAVLDAAAADSTALDVASGDTSSGDTSSGDTTADDASSDDVASGDVPCDATCGGRCVDLATDLDNCGACGRV